RPGGGVGGTPIGAALARSQRECALVASHRGRGLHPSDRRALLPAGGPAERVPAPLAARRLRDAVDAGGAGRSIGLRDAMLKARPGIMDIAPYKGGDSKLPGQQRVIRLASNEGPLGPSPQAIRAYRDLADELHRYPDGGQEELR